MCLCLNFDHVCISLSFLRRRVHDIRLCPRADGQPRSAPWWPLVVTASTAVIQNSQGPNWMERVPTLTDRPACHQTVPRRGLSLRLKMSKCNISTLSAPANANVQLLILKTELLMEIAVGFLKNGRLVVVMCLEGAGILWKRNLKKISVCFFISGALLNIIENMVVYQKMYIVVYLTLLHS